MSFSSLPTELVRQIIESSVPATFHSTTYKDRQATLLSLGLVSRRFLSIAQPMLFEIVWTKSPQELDGVLDKMATTAWRSTSHTVAIQDRPGKWLTANQMEKFIRQNGRLRDLLIDATCSSIFELYALQSMTSMFFLLPPWDVSFAHRRSSADLTRLQLSGTFQPFTPVLLPALESFAFDYQALPAVTSMLDPALLPSLQQLALIEVNLQHEIETLSRTQIRELIKQLEAISLDLSVVLYAPAYLVSAFDRSLLDCHIEDLNEYTYEDLVAVPHLRLTGFHSLSKDDHCSRLSVLAKIIERETELLLRSIYLDISLAPSSMLSQEVCSRMSELVMSCEEKGVEVIYEVQPKVGVDLCFSEEFHRRQIEEKRKSMKKEVV